MSSSSEVEIVSVTPTTRPSPRRRSRHNVQPTTPIRHPEVICLDTDDDDNGNNNNNNSHDKTERHNMGNSASAFRSNAVVPETAVKEEDQNLTKKNLADNVHKHKNNDDTNVINDHKRTEDDVDINGQPGKPNIPEQDKEKRENSAPNDDANGHAENNDDDDDAQFKDSNDGKNPLQEPDGNNDPHEEQEVESSSDDLEELSPSEDESPIVPENQSEVDHEMEPADDSIDEVASAAKLASETQHQFDQVTQPIAVPSNNEPAQTEAANSVRPPAENNDLREDAVTEVGKSLKSKPSMSTENTQGGANDISKPVDRNQEHTGSSLPEKISTPAIAKPTGNKAGKQAALVGGAGIPRTEIIPNSHAEVIPPKAMVQSPVDSRDSGKEPAVPKRKALKLDADKEMAEREQGSPSKRKKIEGPRTTAVSDLPEAKTDLEAVSRTWQMASVVHFFATFYAVLPIEDLLGEGNYLDVSAVTLERAVAEPDTDAKLVYLLRDIIAVLLLALKRVSVNRARTHWFESLCAVAWARSRDFIDTNGSDAMKAYSNNGTLFLVDSPWPTRLSLLLTLCDIAAEEADCIRNAIVPDNNNNNINSSTMGVEGRNNNNNSGADKERKKKEIKIQTARMQAFGRCSQKRWYFRVGACRIYSGFKRKGCGHLKVESSDVNTMQALIDRLSKSEVFKDRQLALKVKDNFMDEAMRNEAEEKKRAQSWGAKEKLRPRKRRKVYTV